MAASHGGHHAFLREGLSCLGAEEMTVYHGNADVLVKRLMQTRREIAEILEKEMQCNCDLDNWEPEKKTGHSWVCRIHKKALETWRLQRNLGS